MTDNTVAGHEAQPGRALAGLLRNWWDASARDGREKPTQQSLAKRLGIDQTTLSRYLNASHASNAPCRIVEQLHSALRAPAGELDRALALARAAAGKRPSAPAGPADDRDPAACRLGRSPAGFPALAVASLLPLALGCSVWWPAPTGKPSDAKASAHVSVRPSEGMGRPLAGKGNVPRKARTVQLLRANGVADVPEPARDGRRGRGHPGALLNAQGPDQHT
ncbi:helix-turn-helix domain-containing protein [Streptomyces gelaticus]|uniref:helix-turn-helix domain-containing protein n=1 Tax=Streptomyces gelaticus TaxID=285446 RepID=UPI0037ACB6C3